MKNINLPIVNSKNALNFLSVCQKKRKPEHKVKRKSFQSKFVKCENINLRKKCKNPFGLFTNKCEERAQRKIKK